MFKRSALGKRAVHIDVKKGDGSGAENWQDFGYDSLDHLNIAPFGVVRAHPLEVGYVGAFGDGGFGDLEADRFLFGVLREDRAAEGVDEEKAFIILRPVEALHDGGADESGVHAAFDEVSRDAQGGCGGPN